MNADLLQRMKVAGADPWFVEFVLAWHGVIGMSEVPFTTEKESRTYQRRIKRWVQRDYGEHWRFYWRVIRDDCWKARRRMKLKRGLFKMEPRGSMTRTRERSEAIWNAVFDLRKYFMTMTGRPHMGLVGQLVYPKQEEGTFHNEWYRRKDEFKDADGWERVAALQTFFWQNHARVLETLQTGIPFYAKWESGGNEGQKAPLS